MRPIKIVFICSPYTASTHALVTKNIAVAELMARRLARHQIGFLCPHTNSNMMHDVGVDPTFWYDMYLTMLGDCDALLALDGWGKSSGCSAEVAYAMKHEIPVFYENEFEDLLVWAGKKRHGSIHK